ncbi:hypothetical protein CKW39_10045 [Kocuria sp. WRN011]|nr:hypothetical protein CKW39_10045 [Kocuria sp. WRN011]
MEVRLGIAPDLVLLSYQEVHDMTATRLAISLTDDQVQRLRVAAAEANIPHGVLGRALLVYGLGKLGNEELEAVIEQETASFRESRSKGGKTATANRWHNKDEPHQKE